MNRRDFVTGAGGIVGVPAMAAALGTAPAVAADLDNGARADAGGSQRRPFNAAYEGEHLEHVAFPLGGIGAGMICLEGAGSLSQLSIRYAIESAREPGVFAALSVKGSKPVARVLEGPVPKRKRRPDFTRHSTRVVGAWWGLPRFKSAKFSARFPFAQIELADEAVPLAVEVTGWSPFEPNDPDNASLPVAGLEYRFSNPGDAPVEAVFSFHAANFMGADLFTLAERLEPDAVRPLHGGFELYGGATHQEPWRAGSFAVWVDDPAVQVNTAWPTLLGFDPIQLVWRDVEQGASYTRAAAADGPSTGASLFVPFRLAPGEHKVITVRLAWFVKRSNLKRDGNGHLTFVLGPLPEKEVPESETYQAWYTGRFAGIDAVVDYWQQHYESLKANSARFSRAFYDSTLPPEVLEAVAANLTILKSPTVLRQADGRFWAWEGSFENNWLSTEGSNTHVWNFAQALPHLFPSLERTLRETEFGPSQRADGHQDFRSALPIRPTSHDYLAAADGQLGGIMKVYRDWRISGDTTWLKDLWPKIRASLDYCIRTWDPRHVGWLEEPHQTTFDVDLWGPDGMCTGIYLGALQAAVLMGRSLRDDGVELYAQLLKKGTHRTATELFNGEYFIQKVRWRDLQARYPDVYPERLRKLIPPNMLELANKEGPPGQFGSGCLTCATVGPWLAEVCGVGQVLDASQVRSHLQAVYRYNFKRDLSAYPNTAVTLRAYFGLGEEGGVVVCTWPNGGAFTLPVVTATEVWTGFEYQVASHLIMMGSLDQGLELVRTCRSRYDGRFRNPFDEVEAGHWYARAMASYALLQGISGARYDAVDKTLHLEPKVKGDFRSFLSTATGYGTVGVREGKPFLEVASGTIPYVQLKYTAPS